MYSYGWFLSEWPDIELWFIPMTSEGPAKAPMLQWVKENFPKDLPKGATVANNYGPPVYQDAQQKFIVQGRRGKPNVIEGVLEGMIAYRKAGLIAPLNEQFDQWSDKDQFVPSTLKALTVNGKQNTRGNDYQATDADYYSGKSAMVPMGPWIYQYRGTGEIARKILEQNTGVIALPQPPGGTPATYLEVKPIMLNANSKDKADAWALIKVLGGKDFIALDNKLEGVNPQRKDVADLPEFKNDWWQQAFTAQLPAGVALAPINWGLVINDITDAMQKVIYKTKSPEDTAKELYNTLGQRAQNNQL